MLQVSSRMAGATVVYGDKRRLAALHEANMGDIDGMIRPGFVGFLRRASTAPVTQKEVRRAFR
jgi:hypothetical protein